MKSQNIIERYNLQPHPEGGFYCVTYECQEQYTSPHTNILRPLATNIYFLLNEQSPVSHLHRIQSDETWHYYTGTDNLVVIDFDTASLHVKYTRMGPSSGIYQYVVKAGNWFGSWTESALNDFTMNTYNANHPTDMYALVGCTVAPGFHFDEFELAKPDTTGIREAINGIANEKDRVVIERMISRS